MSSISLIKGLLILRTNEIVKGKSIDWTLVERLLSYSQLIVAHNAWFDRNMLEKYIRPRNIWACSSNDVDWGKRGFAKSSLELLSIWHGFYYDAHREMNDVNATIYLVTHPYYSNNKPILEIIKNCSPQTKFFQPFSSNIFGNSFKKTQNETERFSPLSIYALGKVTAYYACQLYRDIHGLKIYGAIFYNHESEVRPEEYVTRKITKSVARIYYGKQKRL